MDDDHRVRKRCTGIKVYYIRKDSNIPYFNTDKREHKSEQKKKTDFIQVGESGHYPLPYQ